MVMRRVSTLLLLSLVPFLGHVQPAQAAPPELQIVSETTYEVRPALRAVHVTVEGRATSFRADSAGRTYYYSQIRLAVLGGATNFAAVANGATSSVSVLESTDRETLVELALNRNVQYRQTASFRLEFDLENGAVGGSVRVGANVAQFPAWATGTPETPGSSVTVSVPAGFLLDVQGADLPDREDNAGGGHRYRWTDIPDIATWGLFATADLATVTESTYAETRTEAAVGDRLIEVVVRAWADDEAWGNRTSQRVAEALPVLHELIGVDYFGTRQLRVVETVSRSIGGYAGIFDDSQPADEIQVAFDASEAVTLHEAAHAWFNGGLSSDRWMLEGFASYYGAAAAGRLDVESQVFELTEDLRAAAFPLDEWENPGIESEARELYGYAASLLVAQELADLAGPAGLSIVFRAMAADEAAYQPLHADAVETSYAHPSDWRYLLDLLDERVGGAFDAVLAEWVVTEPDSRRLEARVDAREEYDRLVDRLDAWDVPESLRRQMNAWAFDDAQETITDATEILGNLQRLTARAEGLGVSPPHDGVQTSFENGDLGLAARKQERIEAALDAYGQVLAASREEVDPVEWVGLIGADPATGLASAASALAAGEWDASIESADSARATWEGAAAEGTTRLAIGGGSFAGVLGLVVGAWASRRRNRRAGVAAHPAEELSNQERPDGVAPTG